MPKETAEELKKYGSTKTRSYDLVSVLFTDFKGFTMISEILTPEELVAEIDLCYKEFDRITSKYNIEKIKTIRDAYMCTGGLPAENNTHARNTVQAGLEIRDFMLTYRKQR
ncbi:MAG: adenylate/guanylate cyclase domain-containing protein [Crocinitomicaceae bacterium]|nr:adenylate/guanylate cyclase domain-containing protein [Crocinitomicaceae bacterium]